MFRRFKPAKAIPKLTAEHKIKRVEFAKAFEDGKLKIEDLLISDESTVQKFPNLTGKGLWAGEKPEKVEGSDGKSWSLMFFACVGMGFKSELIFMADASTFKQGERRGQRQLTSFKVNGTAYKEKILVPLHKEFKKRGWIKRGKLTKIFQQGMKLFKNRSNILTVYFFLDGAPSHCTEEVMQWLDKNWSLKRIVSRVTKQYFQKHGKKALIHWPAKSPDQGSAIYIGSDFIFWFFRDGHDKTKSQSQIPDSEN